MKFRGKYEFLSNMFNCGVEWKGEVYRCSETVFQMEKCEREEDKKRFKGLMPGQAKKLGRRIKMRSDWNDIKLQIMKELLRKKFNREPFKQQLIDTGDEELVEGNRWGDTYWGVCRGRGQNKLGKLLMQVRKEINDDSCE